MIEVQLPDGRTISVNTTDRAAAARAARVYMQNEKDPVYDPKEIDPGSENTGFGRNLEAGIRSFASTATRGGSNELAAGLSSVPDVFARPDEIGARFRARLDAQDTRDAADWRDVAPAKAAGTAAGFFATLPAQATTRGLGAIQGGAEGAISGFAGTDGNILKRLKASVLGGAVGAGLGAVGVPSAAKLKTRATIDRLRAAGVKLSPGEISGGMAKRAEEALTSVPGLDSIFGGALKESRESLNRAAINKVLSPIGATLPKSVATGAEAIKYADDVGRAGYEKLLPGLVVNADDTFRSSVDNLTEAVRAEMGDEWANKLAGAYGYHIARKINPQTGKMSGEAMKEADSFLGAEIKNFSSSTSGLEKKYATALRELQSNLRAVTRRSNPEVAGKLRNYDRVFAGNVRLQDAAARAAQRGGPDAAFSPADLSAAVARATGGNKRRTLARGEALLQDLAGDAQSVMARTVPDSGTAARAIAATGALGAGGVAYGLLNDNGQPGANTDAMGDYAKVAATIGIPLLALYTPAGRAAMAKAMQQGLVPRTATSATLRTLPVASGLLDD